MPRIYEWDAAKAAANLAKHRVSFQEAVTVFDDPLALEFEDVEHSRPDDASFVALGLSNERRLVVVVHSETSERIRIISARLAMRRERIAYEEGR